MDDIDWHAADEFWMRRALQSAKIAAEAGEVPVGALVVLPASGDFTNWKAIGESGNRKEVNFDPFGHAEIRAMRQATTSKASWRLADCILYVTLEPCTMCSGAIVHARVGQVVYGATDPKAGAVQSLYTILSDNRLNHRPVVRAGVLAKPCGDILSAFFQARRG